MLSSPHPHRCCDRSNTYKCLLCEIGGLDSKAFKEILYMILHNREQMSLWHHSACFSKVISTKITFQNNVICVFAVFKKINPKFAWAASILRTSASQSFSEASQLSAKQQVGVPHLFSEVFKQYFILSQVPSSLSHLLC